MYRDWDNLEINHSDIGGEGVGGCHVREGLSGVRGADFVGPGWAVAKVHVHSVTDSDDVSYS